MSLGCNEKAALVLMHNKVNGLLHYRSVQTTPVGTSALHWFAGECVRRKPTSNIWGKDDGNRVSAESTPTLAWEREREGKKTREKGKAESGFHTTATLMWFFVKSPAILPGLKIHAWPCQCRYTQVEVWWLSWTVEFTAQQLLSYTRRHKKP